MQSTPQLKLLPSNTCRPSSPKLRTAFFGPEQLVILAPPLVRLAHAACQVLVWTVLVNATFPCQSASHYDLPTLA